MKYILKALQPILRLSYRYPALVILVALMIGVTSIYYALQLRIDTSLDKLLPESYSTVKSMRELQKTVGGETPMEIIVKSPSFEANKKFINDFTVRISTSYDEVENVPLISRYEFRRNVEKLKNTMLYYAKEDELIDIQHLLNKSIKEARQKANPFYVSLDDEEENSPNNGESLIEIMNTIIPTEYSTSSDSQIVAFYLYPTKPMYDIRFQTNLRNKVYNIIDELNPTTYHPEMEVLTGGILRKYLADITSIKQDVENSFFWGLSSVMLIVLIYFSIKKWSRFRHQEGNKRFYWWFKRILFMPIPLIVMGVPLIIAISFTFSLVYQLYGELNIMTSMLFVILFGLTIDYGIHFYVRYIETRREDESISQSLLKTYYKTGVSIAMSAITTASALFVLSFADFRGFAQFGYIAAMGTLLSVLSILYLMPAILVLFDRWGLLFLTRKKQSSNKEKPFKISFPFSRTILGVTTIFIIIIGTQINKLDYEYNIDNMKQPIVAPELLQFEKYKKEIQSASSRNSPSYILANSNEEVLEIVNILKERQKSNGDNTYIGYIESLQERFPFTMEQQQKKLQLISQIDTLLQNKYLINNSSVYIEMLKTSSKIRAPIDINDIPDFLKDRFISKNGELGKFISIYPLGNQNDALEIIAFKNEISDIKLESNKEVTATSTALITGQIIELFRSESTWIIIATFILILTIMFFELRSITWALLTMLPLIIGFLSLFGIMIAFDISFNFFNVTILPAILGIGEDNGIHIVQNYLKRGRDSLWYVLSNVGQHITIGSLTTMVGFLGMLFSHHPGIQSIGVIAIIGIGSTLACALLLLPAIIQIIERYNLVKIPYEDESAKN